MDLKIDGENVINAIAFGSHWPNYVRFFLSRWQCSHEVISADGR